ncbi:MAG: hypothetical protein VB061_10810 [Christensenella sp.]|nr:hypothetical protein [Christensenella sp.]
MLALLDETDQRRIKLLEVLTNQAGWITIGELALAIHASERTIHSDLIYFKNQWDKQLQIDVSLKNGVQLGCHNAAMLHEIQIEIFKSALAPRLIRDVFFFPHQDAEFYTRRLFVSKSTLVRIIPKINAYLSVSKVLIERNELSYCLAASDEMELRKLLSTLYIELNPQLMQLPDLEVELPVPGVYRPVSFSRLYEIVKSMLLQSSDRDAIELVLMDTSALPQMAAFYFVSLIREYQGFHAASSRPLASEISAQDFQYLREHFPSISPENLQPIHALLMKPFLPPEDVTAESRLDMEARAYFERVFKALCVSCPDEIQNQLVQTMKILYHYVLIYPVNISGFIRRINGFIISLRGSHPKLFLAFSESLAVFNRAMQADLTASLPDLIQHSCFLFPALGMASPPRRVFIVSDSGIEHAAFIASFIRSSLNGESYETVQVTPVPYANAIEPGFAESLTSDDIFITTVPNLMQIAPNSQAILFHDFPSIENFYSLLNAIYRN